ncbi:MAG TPA: tyrosine-type recombinase/integrase [Steroidobacteraceae bacterium]|nr:tyrosine-type recombinase/integrase [Steroidobacteraceae bacterium]
MSTGQHAQIVDSWVQLLGLDTTSCGTHTLRRTKATLIYRRTKNLRAVQLLLGHSKLESVQCGVSGSMTLLKWRSKLTCDDATPVGGAGRRPAKTRHRRRQNDRL